MTARISDEARAPIPGRRRWAGSLWFALLLASAALTACGEPCETGAVCARTCPPGGAPICAAHGLCACLLAPDAAPTAAEGPEAGPGSIDPGSDAGPTGAGGEEAPAACATPGPGDLLINELMLDGEPTEDAEFVELVNPGPGPVALAGVELTSNRGADQVRRVEFTGGCLPADAALAVFSERGAWVTPGGNPWPVTAELRSFGFANGGDFDFRLVRGEAVIDRVEGSGDVIEPGVSLNRQPDRVGPAMASHRDVDPGGRTASPGRCPGGGRYEEGCPDPPPGGGGGDGGLDMGPGDAGVGEVDPARGDGGDGGRGSEPDAAVDAGPVFECPLPAPGELRINEVLIDGRVPRTEADEFVEIVNRADGARRMLGLTLAVEGDDGWDPRVVIADGCLPGPGALAVHPDPLDWRFEPPPLDPPVIADARLALGNESRAPIALLDELGDVLDRFDPGGLSIVEGVSLNRSPDLTGDDWRLHDRLAPGDSSPGTCAGGEPFTVDGCPVEPVEDCAPPTLASLVINEVLVDGAEEGDRDEFVELVNVGPAPLALDGLGLWSSRGDGTLVERVAFERGCLPPGAWAIYGDRADWVGGEAATVSRAERLALPNEAPVVVELRREAEVWRAELPAGFADEGISAVRAVDGDPLAPFVPHDAVSEWPASPGARVDGAPFGEPAP